MRMEDGNSSVVGDDQLLETRSSYEEDQVQQQQQQEEEEEEEEESTITTRTVMSRRSTNSISSSPHPTTPTTPTTNNGYFGKHRMAASLSILQLQIQSTQEELDQLESMGGCSAVCPELVTSVESIPDPLLPSSRGPTNENWDRWFRGAHHNTRRRWI